MGASKLAFLVHMTVHTMQSVENGISRQVFGALSISRETGVIC